jgi:hypothetical protein
VHYAKLHVFKTNSIIHIPSQSDSIPIPHISFLPLP